VILPPTRGVEGSFASIFYITKPQHLVEKSLRQEEAKYYYQ